MKNETKMAISVYLAWILCVILLAVFICGGVDARNKRKYKETSEGKIASFCEAIYSGMEQGIDEFKAALQP